MSDSEGLLAGAIRPRAPEDFDSVYKATPAWDIGRPQAAFVELLREGAIQGRVLDVGCGTGEHALLIAAAGLDVTGIDLAAAAIAVAENKASTRGVTAQFLVLSALQLASLDGKFDTVLDCGLFHVLEDDDRLSFVENLKAVTKSGGQYFMLCFSDKQPGKWGPRRISSEDIRASFGEGWRIDSIEPAKFEIWMAPKEAQAWLARVTRM